MNRSACRFALLLMTPILAATVSAAAAPSGSTISPQSTAAPTAPPPRPASPSAAAKVEQHIRRLHGQLGITPAQQPQWDQFAQVMRDNAAQIAQASADRLAHVDALDAADNMQSYARLAQVHAANMQKLASAFQSLYAGFPPAQKQLADGVFRKSALASRRRG